MSDLELKKTAMAPRRWIELCRKLEKQHPNDPDAILRPRGTRFFDDSNGTALNHTSYRFFIVPGGRYLVRYLARYSPGRISVLDLGYTSSADIKEIASFRLEAEYDLQWTTPLTVQATPDGMGLTIFLSNV